MTTNNDIEGVTTMEHYLFRQLNFVRGQTLELMEGVTEEIADRVPEGFRNSIRWNLGHIYVVLERYAFQYIGLPQHLPAGFKEQFEFGTSPSERPESAVVPSLPELESLLKGQIARISDALAHRLQEVIDPPYTTSKGIKLATPEQFFSINLFHEGMHLSVIRTYKRMLGV
jgi:hypothetical protein